MLTSQFAVIALIFNSMAAFCRLFANIHHYAGHSDLLGIIICLRKRSVSSILCAARFRARVLWTAVLSFVLVQDGYKSVLSSGAPESGPRLPLSILADQLIGQFYRAPVTRIWIRPERGIELCCCAGRIQERFVKQCPPDHDRHCRFSPIW
jgi:hypothetical protein